MLFSSLGMFLKKLYFILCLNRLMLFVDFKSDDRLFDRLTQTVCRTPEDCVEKVLKVLWRSGVVL